jgi:uncharacterized membrane protein YdbT with pleckstrin-like domain
MSYIEQVMQPDERVLEIGRIHPLIYLKPICAILVAFALFIAGSFLTRTDARLACESSAAIILVIGLVLFIAAYVRRRFTEIAVTNKRIVYKVGVVRRHTMEMNMNRVESVVVDQTIAGRIFDYGTIHIRGVGEGLENLKNIGHPVAIRNAIIAR